MIKKGTCFSEPVILLDTIVYLGERAVTYAFHICVLIGRDDVGAADKHRLGPIKTQIWKAFFRLPACSHSRASKCDVRCSG